MLMTEGPPVDESGEIVIGAKGCAPRPLTFCLEIDDRGKPWLGLPGEDAPAQFWDLPGDRAEKNERNHSALDSHPRRTPDYDRRASIGNNDINVIR